MNVEAQPSRNKTAIIAGIVIVLVIIAYAVFSRRMPSASNEVQETTVPTQVADTTEPVSGDSEYADGQYEAVGEYRSPGGNESIDVSLTLEDGVVVDAAVVSNATLPNSVQFQGMFVDNFRGQVVGKNIDDLNLTKVSGSSLTPKGFNDAVEKIKAQAQT